ncbi:MAG: T9SS type A sorting domain-containing protein [Bacteroidota bacterium]
MRSSGLFCLILLYFCSFLGGQNTRSELVKKTEEQKALEASILTRFSQLEENPANLELLQIKKSPGGKHLSFRQTYQGLPLYKSFIKVHLDRAGNIRAVRAELFSRPKSPLKGFLIKSMDFQEGMAEKYGAHKIDIEPVLFPLGKDWLPAYQVQIQSRGPVFHAEILIDGRTGKELSYDKLDLSLKAQGDTTATARIFLPNPCSKANVNYGDLFIDNMDLHTSVLESLMDTVQLSGLCFEADSFLLKGPYVEIVDLERPRIAPVKSKDGDFFYQRDEPGFEQVMAYYHIDTFQRWIQSLGFDDLWDGPIRVDPQGTNSDNSITVINDSTPVILFGTGGVDDAEDADVILHEYGHALSYYASGEIASRGSRERAGLDEGIADYMAAIYSQDLGYENWSLLFNWDGHNEFWAGRIANASQLYPPSDSSIYTYGGIWVAAMMEIRESLGKGITDSLFFQQIYLNDLNTDLYQAAQMFLLADSLLFGGIHTEEISFVFCERGLLRESKGDCSVVSSLHQLPTQQFRFYPNPSRGKLSLELAENMHTEKLSCIIYDMQGREVFNKSLTKDAVQEIQLPPLHSGLYYLKIYSSTQAYPAQKFLYSKRP